MKKIGVILIIVGVVIYALGAFLGISVRDDPDIRALSERTGIAIDPNNAEALLKAAADLPGKAHFMLDMYRWLDLMNTLGISSAALGLFLIILSLILKPLISIALLLVILGACYMAYQGNLGPQVQGFMQGVWDGIHQLFNQAISWVRSVPANGRLF